MRWLLSVSSGGYIYYYRNSSTAEYASFSPLILGPEEALRSFPPRMLSGVQERYLVVTDKEELSNIPQVRSLATWRLGCRSSLSRRDLRARLAESIPELDEFGIIKDRAHDTLVLEWTKRHGESPEIVLGALEAFGHVAADGLVYYYPSTVAPEKVGTFREVIEPREFFTDDFRLGAESSGQFRYGIAITRKASSWHAP